MNEAILVSLIGLTGSCTDSVLGIMASAKLTRYRLEQLEAAVPGIITREEYLEIVGE